MIHTEKRARWQGLVLDQGTSGQSIAEFCRARELSKTLFYRWRRKLQEVATPGFVEVQVAKRRLRNGRAKPVVPATGSTIEVRLRNGRSVMVAPKFDASHLRAVLAVVESAS
jgi:transposase-like protein